MKFLICLYLASVASASVIYQGGVGAAQQAYSGGSDPSYGSSGGDSYGGRKCTPYYETVQRDHCESYTEKTCTTTQTESCTDVSDQNCRAVVSSKQTRKCFNVTEQRCNLKEDVQLETIQVPVVVQKCQKVNERVCDTVYEASSTFQEQSECINIENPFCQNVDNTVFDVTCRTVTEFDCETSQPDPYTPGNSGYVSGGNSGSGSGSYSTDSSYGSTDSSYGSSVNSYGQPQVNCRRRQDTKCYKTPRTVTVQQCTRRTEKVCEKVRESVPFVNARQSCRNEEKKVCDLEERSQPKQVKKYVYTQQCQAVPRTVCENADDKDLVPSCVGITRKQCSYSPVEQCQETPKQHCIKVDVQIRKERCENVGGYGGGSTSYVAPGGSQDY